MEVECPYCGRDALLVDSKEVYRKSHGNIWICRLCQAWVGVHKNDGKNRPLGILANDETRYARRMAHDRFDPLWKTGPKYGRSRNQMRNDAYAWLAGHLGILAKDCHIALFDLRTCVRVVEICVQNLYNAPESVERGS